MYEVVIRNGYIYDGLGSNPYIADIAILNCIIVAIGKIEDEALNVIDASGYSVSPGFIISDMTAKISEEHTELMKSRISLNKFGNPEDVANSIAFLSS